MVRRQATRVLYADKLDSDPQSEYEEFRSIEEAMSASGYDKVVAEIKPLDNDIDDPQRLADKLAGKLRDYSVQIFVNDTGSNLLLLVTARQKDANLSRGKNAVSDFLRSQYIEPPVPNHYQGESIQRRHFKNTY